MDVKRFKFPTGFFKDPKIQIIESLPGGDSIIVFLIQMMSLCEWKNIDGNKRLSLSDYIRTEAHLAAITSRPVLFIHEAVRVLSEFMIMEFVDGIICINMDSDSSGPITD